MADLRFTDLVVVDSQLTATRLLDRPDRLVLVDRGRPRWLKMLCPCGCGDAISVNLDARAGASWRLLRNRSGVTLIPSVWRTSGCRSHFLLWSSRIIWCRWEPGSLVEEADLDEFMNWLQERLGHSSAKDGDIGELQVDG